MNKQDELTRRVEEYYEAVRTGTAPEGTEIPSTNEFWHSLRDKGFTVDQIEDTLFDQWVEERTNQLLFMMEVGMGEDPQARLERNKYTCSWSEEGVYISFGEYDR